MPCEVWFYHLERTSLDQALPELLEKTLARQWRALVRSPSRERIEHLDGWLWSYRDDAFLPQPVAVSIRPDTTNRSDGLFLIDGGERGDISPYQRCIVLFDGRDEAALGEARRRWSAFKGAGHPVSYWRQGGEGGWRKKA